MFDYLIHNYSIGKMKLLSHRNFMLVLPTCAALGVLLWYGQENIQQSPVRAATNVQAAAPGNSNEKGSSLVSMLSDPRLTTPIGQGRRQNATGAKSADLFNESV